MGRWVKCSAPKICRVTRHDTEELQKYVNKKPATGIDDEAVTQKKKSPSETLRVVRFRRLDDCEQGREHHLR